jgi:hypothetical protein
VAALKAWGGRQRRMPILAGTTCKSGSLATLASRTWGASEGHQETLLSIIGRRRYVQRYVQSTLRRGDPKLLQQRSGDKTRRRASGFRRRWLLRRRSFAAVAPITEQVASRQPQVRRDGREITRPNSRDHREEHHEHVTGLGCVREPLSWRRFSWPRKPPSRASVERRPPTAGAE